MVLRNHQHEAVAAEWKCIEATVVDGAGYDADVGIAFGNQPNNLVAQTLLEVHADVRIGHQERTQRLGEKLGQSIGVGEYTDLAGQPARKGAEILLEPLGLSHDAAGVLQQGTAGRCRRNARTATHQEGRAEGHLHFADTGRGGGKRQIRARRTMRYAARLDDVAEQIEVGEIEPHGATFLFYEGRLRKTHIATLYF